MRLTCIKNYITVTSVLKILKVKLSVDNRLTFSPRDILSVVIFSTNLKRGYYVRPWYFKDEIECETASDHSCIESSSLGNPSHSKFKAKKIKLNNCPFLRKPHDTSSYYKFWLWPNEITEKIVRKIHLGTFSNTFSWNFT